VNTIDFSTNQISLSAAYHKALDNDNTQFLSIGIQGGISQKNVNYERLSFEDQFNGIDGYPGMTIENLPPNNFSFGDIQVGINYTIALDKTTTLFFGGALHHVLSPRISFYYDKEDSPDFDERLHRKYSAQASGQFYINERLQLIPRVLLSLQGPHMRINAGSNLRIPLNNYSTTALQVGTWLRPVKSVDTPLELDALVILAAIELGSVQIGLSYDLSLDDVANYQQGQSAFEISVTHIGSFENDSILCPSF
ncbi:MAG: PorP/SprF family type IX secretion system membrane protein, partial [Saprospiraceae bacterium]|nr:PorP/SprF family type IX secretion system membrane protein [Saprospiraceae bacterium]